jgi:hypothetical protein
MSGVELSRLALLHPHSLVSPPLHALLEPAAPHRQSLPAPSCCRAVESPGSVRSVCCEAQVLQVVELGSPSPDADKYSAIGKWAGQLRSLQTVVVSKLAV